MSFVIRRADRRHLADINRLCERFASPMKELSGPFWFVRIDGEIVGCVGVEFYRGTGIVTHLAVEREFRHRGVGMALFRCAEAFLRSGGADIVSFITMYYNFRRFKKRGYRTIPRATLPPILQDYWMYTAKHYMKCAAMIRKFS